MWKRVSTRTLSSKILFGRMLSFNTKKIKVNKENLLYIFATLTIILFLGFVIPIPIFVEVDFYDFHVWECEQAHGENMTYLVCSGFWVEPSASDFDNSMAVHPLEDCSKCIAHGSNLGTGEIVVVFGIYGWITTPHYR